MALPINKRDFDIFLSHAHKDHRFVSELDRWLTDKAGFTVWYDKRELAGGSLLATDLQSAISRCRGCLLIASEEALARGWINAEYNSAMDERANYGAFRVVCLKPTGTEPKGLMKGTTWIDVPNLNLDSDTTLAIIRAFYPGDNRPNPSNSRDAYISCSWQKDDAMSGEAVCHALADQGFRLVGDAKDQEGFKDSTDRIKRIMASCGAFVAIIPFRGQESATAKDSPYKYFLQEIDFATELKLPSIVIADPAIRRSDGSDASWIRMATDQTECPQTVLSSLSLLEELWQKPSRPHYVFCAMDLECDAAQAGSPIRNMIERITGMPTIVGNEIHKNPLQTAIMETARDAFLLLADITDDNLNSCIEAGMGLAGGATVELIAKGKPRRPPFMLRALQMLTYENEVERLGILHKILRRYRRRIINAEL